MMRLDMAHSSRAPAFGWLLALALVLALALGETGPAAAQAEFSVKAAQAILMDADTGAIMYQRNADELMSPASMSKLMTLTVLFKALKAGELKLSDEFLMSENAWRKGGAPSGTSAMFVPLGTRATVEELIKGITVSRAMMPRSRSPKTWRVPRTCLRHA